VEGSQELHPKPPKCYFYLDGLLGLAFWVSV